MQIFIFDNVSNTLKIDNYAILLIKEFKNLWDVERNKCETDKSGEQRQLAYKELTYIYLMLDFKSPYFQYTEQDKHIAALSDSGLNEAQLKDTLFINAYNKYQELLESDPILGLIKTAHRTLYKMQIFLDNIDFNEDVDETGRPLYKPKDIIADIGSIGKMRTQLQELEIEYKKNLQANNNKLKGDIEPGFGEV